MDFMTPSNHQTWYTYSTQPTNSGYDPVLVSKQHSNLAGGQMTLQSSLAPLYTEYSSQSSASGKEKSSSEDEPATEFTSFLDEDEDRNLSGLNFLQDRDKRVAASSGTLNDGLKPTSTEQSQIAGLLRQLSHNVSASSEFVQAGSGQMILPHTKGKSPFCSSLEVTVSNSPCHMSTKKAALRRIWMSCQLRSFPNRRKIRALAELAEISFKTAREWLTEFIRLSLIPLSGQQVEQPVEQPLQATCVTRHGRPTSPFQPRNVERKYICIDCHRTFKRKNDWIKHTSLNYVQSYWQCSDCEYRCAAKRKDKLTQHFVLKHPHEELAVDAAIHYRQIDGPFEKQCGFCGHICKSFGDFTEHVSRHFEDNKADPPYDMRIWRDPWTTDEAEHPDHSEDDDDDPDDSNQEDGQDEDGDSQGSDAGDEQTDDNQDSRPSGGSGSDNFSNYPADDRFWDDDTSFGPWINWRSLQEHKQHRHLASEWAQHNLGGAVSLPTRDSLPSLRQQDTLSSPIVAETIDPSPQDNFRPLSPIRDNFEQRSPRQSSQHVDDNFSRSFQRLDLGERKAKAKDRRRSVDFEPGKIIRKRSFRGEKRLSRYYVSCPLCHQDRRLMQLEADNHITEHLHSFALQSLPWEILDQDSSADDKTVASMQSQRYEALWMTENDGEDEEVDWDEPHDISTIIDDINAKCNSLRSEAIKYRVPGLSDVLGDLLGFLPSMTLIWARSRNDEGELDKLMSFLVKLQSMLSQNVGTDVYLDGDILGNLRQSIVEVLKHERPSEVEEDQGPKPDMPSNMAELASPHPDKWHYTVGWICAISTEYDAAQALLDEKHHETEYVFPNDNNYTLGKICKNNAVIAVGGEYGTSSATSVADMPRSFPNVRIGLMVGIGGGAPSRKHDVRLGDIVVSDGEGGVFQYDFGKTIQDRSFQQTGFLNEPPIVLRAAVNGFKALYESEGHRLEETTNSILEKKPRLRQRYKRPDLSSDRLYQTGVTHPPNYEASCAAVCGDDLSSLILRLERTKGKLKSGCMNLTRVGAFVEGFRQFGEVVEVLLNTSEFAFVWGPMKFMLQVASDYTEALDTLLSAYEKIAEYLPLVEQYRALFSSNGSNAHMDDALAKIYGDILDFHSRALRFFNLSTWRQVFRSVWKDFNSRFGHILTDLRRHKELIESQATALQFQQYQEDNPTIHYGLIASANRLLRDASYRDKLAAEKDVLCFEMEAAGLINHFPRPVILGICDYSDSHRNKEWQGYAAMAAAASRKDLLCRIPPNRVEAEMRIGDVLSGVQKGVDKLILGWLIPIDYAPQQHDYIGRLQPGTGQWLLDSAEFHKWLRTGNQTLFCPGIPGAGKTILAALTIDALTRRFQDDPSVGITYIYCNFRQQNNQKVEDLLASLLKQLSQGRSSLPDSVKVLYDHNIYEQTRPSFEEISRTFQSVAAAYSRAFTVVDALDECQASDGCRMRFLSELFNLQVKYGVNFFANSRFIPEITYEFKGSMSLEIRASNEDVLRYLDGHMFRLPGFVVRSPELQEEIKRAIVKAVDGMFLLAQLCLDALMGKLSPKAIRATLKKPPEFEAYDQVYKDSMERIEGQVRGFRQLAKQVLSWIICAERPLTPAKLQHALAVEVGAPKLDKDNFTLIGDMISVCAGSVTVDEMSNIDRLVHHTTREYLFSTFESRFCTTDQEFEERLQSNQLYDYAACNWGHHTRKALTLSQTVLDFLESEIHVQASSQAKMAAKRHLSYPNYSQDVPRDMNGPHLAAYFGLEEAIYALAVHCHDLDAKDTWGRTPLLFAAEKGYEAVTKLLLEKGAELESKGTQRGWTPLAKLLVEKGVELKSKDDKYGWTPLMYAAANGHETVAKLLVEKGAELESKDTQRGRTPLWWAAAKGHEAVAKLLVEKGAELESKDDEYGWTPLMCAAANGHEAVAKLLLEKGAELESKDTSWGRTPQWWAAAKGHEEVAKLLVEKGAELEFKDDEYGWTPLMCAAANGHEVVVKHRQALKSAEPKESTRRQKTEGDGCGIMK